MRVILCAADLDAAAAAPWLAALRQALPRAQVDWRDALQAAPMTHPAPPQADFALVWRPPPALFAEQRRLRAIFNLGAGVDALLDVPGLPEQVPIHRLEDAGMADALAEYVLAAVLRVHRGLDRYAAQQRAALWRPLPLVAAQRLRVGVLGLGVIGTRIAQTLAAHGYAVRGHARGPHAIAGVACSAGDAALDAFLDRLDILVNVLPLTPATRGLLDAGRLGRLADGAHLVNVGRGAVLADADLLESLARGKLGGATLDVFAVEPLPPQHPFWQCPAILVTPHVSAPTRLEDSVAQVAAKIERLERGLEAGGRVDRQRGY